MARLLRDGRELQRRFSPGITFPHSNCGGIFLSGTRRVCLGWTIQSCRILCGGFTLGCPSCLVSHEPTPSGRTKVWSLCHDYYRYTHATVSPDIPLYATQGTTPDPV
uniref:Uncharacterized protein n=1 Tax=Cacopsylla melanoneura TaxID=428564 RepID=A0A8D8RZF8_9HEMI